MNRFIKIAPSILSADFSKLGEQIIEATEGGADYIHIDVMDGRFVPNITIGASIVKSIRTKTDLPLDIHLMIEKPENQIPLFVEAGADIITVHAEACPHLHRTVNLIRKMGVKSSVSLNPGSPLCLIDEVLPSLDMVLMMTVNPGFGGQSFVKETVDKIARTRQKLDQLQLETELEVDGGINSKTAELVTKAGATVLVAGTAIFHHPEGIKFAIQQIKDKVNGREIDD
ncbi:MAG: ribulose-phosphate 3-epimerase [Dehalococcoidia bacterium]|nr:ribulose-phosphate 3-epimerase [Dehalococcoidia bacterium]